MKIRIALIVAEDGSWAAYGDSSTSDFMRQREVLGWIYNEQNTQNYWVEVEVPSPQTETIPGNLEKSP